MDPAELDRLVRKYTLMNAVEHSGTAQAKTVLGRLLADEPDLRKNALQIKSLIDNIVEEINAMKAEKQKQELDSLGMPPAIKKTEKKILADLDVGRSFVIRFAPNPDGCLHLGNARPAVLCDEYRKKYKGKFILRFDDTDPKIKVPEEHFYKWIKEDLRWMKIKWDSEIVASKRLQIYYSYAEKLARAGNAYVCTCDSETWKTMRDKSRSCPCRRNDAKQNIKLWKKMLAANASKKSAFKEGQAVLRIKTDLEAKNPAVRDWPAFRIVDKPRHPLSKKKLWPLYNFASAVDDHLLGVTHIFRGQEHTTNEVKQRYMYHHFGWKYPFNIVLGRFSLAGAELSKSQIRAGIAEGRFSGWDDLRLGTLKTLKRRGFQPEAVRQIIVDIGVKPSDITISFENLSAYNRKIIDKTAHRFFFIPVTKKIIMDKVPLKSVSIPVHPDEKKKRRTIKLGKTFYIDEQDYQKLKGLEVRLKDLFNIKLGENVVYTGKDVKSLPKIQWVSEDNVPVMILLPGKEIKGIGESNIAKKRPGDIVQFERFGFVRLEKVSKSGVVAVFAHE